MKILTSVGFGLWAPERLGIEYLYVWCDDVNVMGYGTPPLIWLERDWIYLSPGREGIIKSFRVCSPASTTESRLLPLKGNTLSHMMSAWLLLTSADAVTQARAPSWLDCCRRGYVPVITAHAILDAAVSVCFDDWRVVSSLLDKTLSLQSQVSQQTTQNR